jgi:hypothetical protein
MPSPSAWSLLQETLDDSDAWSKVWDRISRSFPPDEAERLYKDLQHYDLDEVEDWLGQMGEHGGSYLPDELVQEPPANNEVVPIQVDPAILKNVAASLTEFQKRVKDAVDRLLDSLDHITTNPRGLNDADLIRRITAQLERQSVFVKYLPIAVKNVRAGRPTRNDLNLIIASLDDGPTYGRKNLAPKNAGPVVDWARSALRGTIGQPKTTKQMYADKASDVLTWIGQNQPIHKSKVANRITAVYGKDTRQSRQGPYGTIGRWIDKQRINVDAQGMVTLADPKNAESFNRERIDRAFDLQLDGGGRGFHQVWYALKYAAQGLGWRRALDMVKNHPRFSEIEAQAKAEKEFGDNAWLLQRLSELPPKKR